MLNKIQKGKRWLIAIGIILIVLAAMALVGAVVCTIFWDARWWMMLIAVVLYILGILGLMLGITFVWTAAAMKATIGSLMEANIALNGTVNANLCPNCGASIKPDDQFCPECGKETSETIVCKKCNAKNARTAKTCTKCGEPL